MLRNEHLSLSIALLPVVVVSGFFALSVSRQVELAVNFDQSVFAMLPLTLLITSLAPLVVAAAAFSRVVLAVALTALACSSLIAMSVSTFAEGAPASLNVVHFEDADRHTADWVVADGAAFPHHVPAYAELALTPNWQFPWGNLGRRFRHRAAQVTGRPPPAFEVIEDRVDHGIRQLSAMVSSSRSATNLNIFIPRERLESFAIDEQVMPLGYPKWRDAFNGYYPFTISGLYDRSVRVTMRIRGTEPITIVLADTSRELIADSAGLLEQRPASLVPTQEGDISYIVRRVTLAAENEAFLNRASLDTVTTTRRATGSAASSADESDGTLAPGDQVTRSP